jgi:crotonobetainyl-CoA:carnitine CoA-transferase CaiB-like acyl-CoA transferase
MQLGNVLMKDLEGLLGISLEQAVAAPYTSCKLADAGARVIKVEREEGDFARNYDKLAHGESAYFVWLNRGKESVCLDPKKPEDIVLMSNIIAKADILIQNFAPGAVARLAFGAVELTRKYPSLICHSLSGYGEVGPCRDQKAYVQTKYGNDPPQRVGVRHPTIAPHGAFRCADVLGDGALATNPLYSSNVNRVKNRPAIRPDSGANGVWACRNAGSRCQSQRT